VTDQHDWQVAVAEVYDRGEPAGGAEERILVQGAETEARRVYADTVATAAEKHYEYVKLRNAGRDIETWPQPTGWTC
jgi:hypothetical protein